MCSETVLHRKKQIHFSRFNCFVITVNREHRMIPYFIILYTNHVCCKNVTTWLTPMKCPHPSNSHSKYVHFSWAYYLNINIDHQQLSHTQAHTYDYLLSFNQHRVWTPGELSWWYNIRPSETQRRNARLSPPPISYSWWKHTAWMLLEQTDHILFLSHNPHGLTSGTGTENRADIPQNTLNLGQVKNRQWQVAGAVLQGQ